MYYYYNHSTFAFATDYRALLALPYVGKQLDEYRLYTAFSDIYHIDTESTFFARIKRLPQAHRMQVSEQGLYRKKYWTPGSGKKIHYNSEEEYAKKLYHIINNAIQIRLDYVTSKMASEFSGGLDSSVVTVLAHRELSKKNKELIAYSWSPSYMLLNKLETDERELINAVSDKEGFVCNLRTTYLTPEEELLCPPVITDGQRTYELRKIYEEMSLQELRLVMSGWGGDEGISHRADLYELLIQGYVGHFINEAYNLAKGSLTKFMKIILAAPYVYLFRPYGYLGRQNKNIPFIMKKEFAKDLRKYCKKDVLHFKTNPIKHLESGVTVSRTEITSWIGADYNIQYLFPFLDHRVIDFAMTIPRHLYYKHGLSRYIYRKAFENILSRDLIYNTSKIDISREVYFRKTEDLQRKAELLFEKVNKDTFSRYLDWNKVKELIDKKYFQEYSRESVFTLLKLQICYDLQCIQKEVEIICSSD